MANGHCPDHGRLEHALGVLEAKVLGQAETVDDVRELASKAGAKALEVDGRVSRLFWVGAGISMAYGLVMAVVALGVALVRLGVIGGGSG